MDILLQMEQTAAMQSGGEAAFTTANCRRSKQCVPPSAQPSTQTYVSMFRIGGVAILPPLMTPEKRRHMQKLKEKAMRLERILEERRRKKLRLQLQEVVEGAELEPNEEQPPETTRSWRHSSCSGSVSQRSNASVDERQHYSARKLHDAAQAEDPEDPYELLSSLMRSREGRINISLADDAARSSANDSELLPTERNLMERMQKLQKSETLIYDNRANTIIVPMSGVAHETELLHLRDVEEQANLNYLHPQKPSKQIPSICVDPPTPLVGTRTMCEALSANASFDSIDISDNLDSNNSYHNVSLDADQTKVAEQQQSSECGLSSDESFNCSQISLQRDGTHALRAHTKVTNITAKIIQFEQLQDTKHNNSHHSILEPAAHCGSIRPPQRSATSPSLKQLAERTSPRSCLDVSASCASGCCDDDDTTRENPLVRSNSFTLDCPSKALLEHIRQQAAQRKSVAASTSSSPSAHALRDTVESKAKRVQKVEVKTRLAPLPKSPQLRRAVASHSFSAAAASPFAGGGGGAIGSNSQAFRAKRSPYELKSAATKAKLTRQLKKSSSNTAGAAAAAALKQVKSKISMPNIARAASAGASSNSLRRRAVGGGVIGSGGNVNSPTVPASATSVDLFGEIQAEHRHKFHALIAQQQEEQRRMQHAFEAQQQLLLEQLNVEMSRAQLGAQSSMRNNAVTAAITPPHSERRRHSSNSFTLHIDGQSGALLVDASPPLALHDEMVLRSPTLSGSSSIVSSTSYTVACDLPPLLDNTATASSSTLTTTSTALHAGASGVGRFTPRRRLFTRELTPSALNANGGSGSGSSPSGRRHHQLQREKERRGAAATCINACARGFLVRRLFATEQIQRIVQTIRDTLIFVLNLHLETAENTAEANTPANIKLKARLLQQLSSASRTLHLVFFQTTLKERMEIIGRDRKRMKTKLLSMNIKRSPRILG